MSTPRTVLIVGAGLAGARCAETLRAEGYDGELVLVVVDNGRGFDPAVLAGRVGEGHIGLASQRLRVESVGGRLEIHTGAGSGTTAVVRLPSAH